MMHAIKKPIQGFIGLLPWVIHAARLSASICPVSSSVG